MWTVVSSGPRHSGFRGTGEEYPETHTMTLHCTSERGETVVIEVSRQWAGLSDEELMRRIKTERTGELRKHDEERGGRGE